MSVPLPLFTLSNSTCGVSYSLENNVGTAVPSIAYVSGSNRIYVFTTDNTMVGVYIINHIGTILSTGVKAMA